MKAILGRVIGVAIALAVVGTLMTSLSFAQCTPNPSLWTIGSIPPGRTLGTPLVCYDPVTGIMAVNGRGVNGVSDTVGNAGTIGGDDVGFISLLVTGPPATANLLPAFGDGIAWISQYFNGRQQSIGNAITGQYVPTDQGDGFYRFSQYPTGLTAADFGEVEIATNFAPQAPGGIMFGRVQIAIPEPATGMVVLGSVLFGLLKLRRRG